jgi:hypothetical protein
VSLQPARTRPARRTGLVTTGANTTSAAVVALPGTPSVSSGMSARRCSPFGGCHAAQIDCTDAVLPPLLLCQRQLAHQFLAQTELCDNSALAPYYLHHVAALVGYDHVRIIVGHIPNSTFPSSMLALVGALGAIQAVTKTGGLGTRV